MHEDDRPIVDPCCCCDHTASSFSIEPIFAIYGPEYCGSIHSKLNPRMCITIWRSIRRWVASSELIYESLKMISFFLYLSLRELREVSMCPAMSSDLMSLIMYAFYDIWIELSIDANNIKRRRNIVLLKSIKKFWCVLLMWTIIECKRNILGSWLTAS